jgi:uroporphyrinogen decarboxylase
MTNKERLLNAFNNRPVDRVPVGFWFHFLPHDAMDGALEKPELGQMNINGHKAFIDAFHPDFVKVMSDGYFHYPIGKREDFRSPADLKKIQVYDEKHPWIKAQAELVKSVVSLQKDTAYFYNVFSPAGTLQKFLGDETFCAFLAQEPETVSKALNDISLGLLVLAEQIIRIGGADGVYYSVSNPNAEKISDDNYLKYIAPSEMLFLSGVEKISENNILHICGYHGKRNNLALYKDYPAKSVNWAVNVENVSLAEGKKLFDGRAVIGGFANPPESLIHIGSREEVSAFTHKIIEEAGNIGVIIGADCTIPGDTPLEHLEWVRQAANQI